MDGPRLAVVIPAHDEAPTIADVVRGVRSFALAVVVDDGSGDGTGPLAARAGAHVVGHATSRGYDAALSTGFAFAARRGCTHVVTMDADGQHAPETARRLAQLLAEGNELVLGVRPAPARLSEHVFSLYTRLMWGVRDPLCGMKGYSMALYASLGHFDAYRSVGTELMLYGLRRRVAWVQAPVSIAPRSGRSGFGGALRGNWHIFRALLLGVARGRSAQTRKRRPARP